MPKETVDFFFFFWRGKVMGFFYVCSEEECWECTMNVSNASWAVVLMEYDVLKSSPWQETGLLVPFDVHVQVRADPTSACELSPRPTWWGQGSQWHLLLPCRRTACLDFAEWEAETSCRSSDGRGALLFGWLRKADQGMSFGCRALPENISSMLCEIMSDSLSQIYYFGKFNGH